MGRREPQVGNNPAPCVRYATRLPLHGDPAFYFITKGKYVCGGQTETQGCPFPSI